MTAIVTDMDIKEGIRRYQEEVFPSLSEEEQILTLAGHRLGAYYEVHDGSRPREEVAMEFLVKNFGPKFAERVFPIPACRRILRVDEPPCPSETRTEQVP